MWEAIKAAIESPNLYMIIITFIIIIIIGIILVKTNVLTINTKHVKLGAEDKERDIIRQQVDFAHHYCEALLPRVHELSSESDDWHSKYILERAYDEVVDWITFNHISNGNAYVHVKQRGIRSLVLSLVTLDAYKSDTFLKELDTWVADLINELINIREVYK